MKKKLIILFSVIIAFIFISEGYGFWEKTLTIYGCITIDPEKITVEDQTKINSITPDTVNEIEGEGKNDTGEIENTNAGKGENSGTGESGKIETDDEEKPDKLEGNNTEAAEEERKDAVKKGE